jgi:hypothetical protein
MASALKEEKEGLRKRDGAGSGAAKEENKEGAGQGQRREEAGVVVVKG